MAGCYRTFITKVAEGRHTTPDKIDAIGQGRVWTGAQAKERGLVDALGGLDTAVAIAKQRAHIPADEEVELVVYSPRRSFYEALTQLGRSSSALSSWGLLMNRLRAGVPVPVTAFRRGEPLALMPYAFLR